MQAYATQIQEQIWNKLFQIFNKFTQGKSTITVSQVENVVKIVLKQDSQTQIDYVIKNIFRLDVDGNGEIDFKQFANFLLKRHCGQIALQKFHKQGKISNSKNMKINISEFVGLLNQAYSFLEIATNQSAIAQLFKSQDTNKDGFITYIEYFQFIQKYLCRTTKFQQIAPQITQNQKQGKQINSRLRKYIWFLLRQLYNTYDYDKSKTLDPQELKKLIIQVLDICTQKQINFVIFNIFKFEKGGISYEAFANYFIIYIAQLGLSRFITFQNFTKRRLDASLFMSLFKQSFKCLNMFRIKDQLLQLIFIKIDKDNDGWITFDQYNNWINRFLAVYKLYNNQYLIIEDNQNQKVGLSIWEEDQKVKSRIRITQPSYKFSNYDLSTRVRQQTFRILVPFDTNRNKIFQEQQVVEILRNLLRADNFQIFYVVGNVFRYDTNNDGAVTYDQFTNFFVQQHCGEMAIQRLHLKNMYKRGNERMLSLEQFRYTINLSLSYIDIQASQQQLNNLFTEIDLDNDGWITYIEYFLFLKYYFGSLRTNVISKTTIAPIKADKNLSAAQRFAKFIRQPFWAALHTFDRNRNLLFDQDEIIVFLREYLKQTDHEIDYILKFLFAANINSKSGLEYEYIRNLVLRVHVGDIILKRLHQAKKFIRWQQFKLNIQDFILLMNTALAFLKVLPNRDLLVQVFKFIDTNKDQWITYQQYFRFIFEYLGLGFGEFLEPELSKSSYTSSNIDDTQLQQFYGDIISQLKIVFHKYDKNNDGHLDQHQLESLIKEVLHETTKRELDYVFWNMFRVDPNKDRRIQFLQFAPFILKHSAELALQRFHAYQTAGKKNLSSKQFSTIAKNAYGFLTFLPRHDILLQKIFSGIDKDHDQLISYKEYIVWANVSVAAKIR